jgi:hypothetical protein
MSTHNDLLKARFHLNMGRINGLVKLVFSDFDPLKPTGPFQSGGARADILRSIIVFLHATFEDVLRSHLPKPNRSLSFYSRTDLEKALKLSGIDAKPFRPLYPPLTQMAKRRKHIVHQADLSAHTAVVSEVWGVADDWQLIMWLMAVPAFYYQLRMSTGAATVVERAMYGRLRAAMLIHVDFGKQLLALPTVPPELHIRLEALRKIVVTLDSITAILKLDVSDFIVNQG